MTGRRNIRAFLFLLLALVCSGSAAAEEVVRINGTGAGMVLAGPVIAAFQKNNRGIRFEMERSLGSAASLKAIAAGALDIAIAGRQLKPHEMLGISPGPNTAGPRTPW